MQAKTVNTKTKGKALQKIAAVLGRLYYGLPRVKAALVVLVLAVYLVLTVYSGGSIVGVALVWGALAFYIVLPGMFWAQLLRVQKIGGSFSGPLALLLGCGFFAAVFCVAARLGQLWLVQLVPPVLALAYLARLLLHRRQIRAGAGRAANAAAGGLPGSLGDTCLPGGKKATQGKRGLAAIRPEAWLLILLAAFLTFVYTFAGPVKNGLPSAVGNVLLNQDLLWNAGNAESFLIAFPPQDIRFYNVRLHYHYLTELLAGGLSAVTGLTGYSILGFYLQPPVLCALVYCLYRFARILWGEQSRFRALLFTYSLFLFACASLWKILPNGISVFWNSHQTHLLTNINSVTTSVVFLCIFLGLFVLAARQKYRVCWQHALLLPVAFFMLTFAKGPLAALVAVALVLSVLVGLPLRQSNWRGLLLAVVVGAMFALVYTTMFSSGANDSMALRYYGTLEKGYFVNILAHFNRLGIASSKWVSLPFHVLLCVAQMFLMVPAAALPYARGLAHDLRHFKQITPVRLLANAMAVGGFAAFFLFDHTAMSQVYFAFGGIFFVYLLAVDSLPLLLPQLALWESAAPEKSCPVKAAFMAAGPVAEGAAAAQHGKTAAAPQEIAGCSVGSTNPAGSVNPASSAATPAYPAAVPVRHPLARRALLLGCAFFAAVGLATSGFLYVHHLGSGARQLLRNLGITEKYPYDVVMNADDEAAAAWLRANTERTSMFATNRIHTGGRLEGISNLYSGLSGRQAFMEGFQYAKTNMGVPEAEINRRLAINTALFNDATAPEEVVSLMQANGISYLVFTTQMSTNFDTYYAVAGAQLALLEVVFTSDTVTIYALPQG